MDGLAVKFETEIIEILAVFGCRMFSRMLHVAQLRFPSIVINLRLLSSLSWEMVSPRSYGLTGGSMVARLLL